MVTSVGSAVTSVYGGVADREKLQLYKPTPRTETIRAERDQSLMDCYTMVARLTETGTAITADARDALLGMLEQYAEEWLLQVEMLAVADEALRERILNSLSALRTRRGDLSELIALALAA